MEGGGRHRLHPFRLVWAGNQRRGISATLLPVAQRQIGVGHRP
jgi:hypothetical protein